MIGLLCFALAVLAAPFERTEQMMKKIGAVSAICPYLFGIEATSGPKTNTTKNNVQTRIR
jgi:hypothetical protein